MTGNETQPGDVLRDAREAMNVSVREVADALNLPVRVVEAIEANDFSNIQPTFARGYIRVYAKLFELEADPLVIQYEELVGDPSLTVPIIENTNTNSPLPSLVDKSQVMKPVGIGIGILIVVVVLVIVFWPSSDGDAAASQSNMEIPETEIAEGAELKEEVALPVVREEPESNAVALRDDDAQPLFEEVAQLPEYAALTTVVTSHTPAENQLEKRITESGDNLLHFEFSEDCWVQVKNTEGGNLYSDLSRSGSSLDLVGEGPFRILLGYAPGVMLEYNQTHVALKPHTRNNVASLVIGQ